MSLIDYGQIPACIWNQQFLMKIFIPCELVQSGDDTYERADEVLMIPIGWVLGGLGTLCLVAIPGIITERKSEARNTAEKFEFEGSVLALVEKHATTLRRKRLQLVHTDDYGKVFTDAWEREVWYFIDHMVRPLGPSSGMDAEQTEFARATIERVALRPMDYGGRPDTASMNPNEYEHFCAGLLREAGWEARVTVATGDQGVDVFATRDGLSLVVQAKRYTGTVGNAAVQEALAGKQFMGADYAAVVSPAQFTKSAVQLANTTGVALLHHDELRDFTPVD